MNTLDLKEGMKLKGSYIIRKFKAGTKELISEQRVENLIMVGAGYGANLILRALIDDATYTPANLPIDSAAIGSGSTAPTTADTGLQTSVLSGILVASTEILSNSAVSVSFFIPDASLANGTYREFGIFCNGRLFARSLITPVFVKTSNQDTTVDYTISYS